MGKKRISGYSLQNVGLFSLLLCITGAIFAMGNIKQGLRMEFTVMFMGTFLTISLAGFKLTGPSIILGLVEEIGYMIYKLFFVFTCSDSIDAICYVWFILPLFSAGAMIAFIYGRKQTKIYSLHLKESRIK